MNEDIQKLAAKLEQIEKRLAVAEAKDAIRDLITDYARGCDRGNDPAFIAPLFTEDGTWECEGFGRYEGRDAVAGGLEGIAGEKIWWSLHYMISPQITFNQDITAATAFWYLWESATVPNAASDNPEPHWIGGTYDTEIVCIEGTWLFRSMKLNLDMVSPYSYGWVERRFPAGGTKVPFFERLEPRKYFWCSCGRSQKQPYCDGAHQGSESKPLQFEVEQETVKPLCGCKRTRTPPYCDGTHLNLKLSTS